MLKLDGFANGDDVSGPGSLAGGCCFDFKKACTTLRALALPPSGNHCTLHSGFAVLLRPKACAEGAMPCHAIFWCTPDSAQEPLVTGSKMLQHDTLPTWRRCCAGPGPPLCGRH